MKFRFTFKGIESDGLKIDGERVPNEGPTYHDRIRSLIQEKANHRFNKLLSTEDGDVQVILSKEKNN